MPSYDIYLSINLPIEANTIEEAKLDFWERIIEDHTFLDLDIQEED